MGHDESDSPAGRSNLRLLTRLVVGGALSGYDGLINRLARIEADLDNTKHYDNEQTIAPEDQPPNSPAVSQTDELSRSDRFRYAMVGLIFDTNDSISRGLGKADRLSLRVGGWLDRLTSPVYSSRLLSPIRNRMDNLAQRGQNEVDRWIEIGRKEEKLSRELTNRAFTEQVDRSIDYLTSNPEVQELVQSQSVGLIGEIVEETRERTVSADYFIEAWARTILRRPMRSNLPEPPQELKDRAMPYRRIQGKVVKK
jgi:hypothetical protein